jgi:hypothetical protein
MPRSTPRNTQQMYVHMPQVLSRNPIFLVWRATGEVLQMERSEWCITISAWLSSVGFLYFGEFFLEVSDAPMLLCWEGLCFVFKNQGVKVQCACTFFHCHNRGFCGSLEVLQYMVCRITQTTLFSCWSMMGACFQTFSWRHFFCHVITPNFWVSGVECFWRTIHFAEIRSCHSWVCNSSND